MNIGHLTYLSVRYAGNTPLCSALPRLHQENRRSVGAPRHADGAQGHELLEPAPERHPLMLRKRPANAELGMHGNDWIDVDELGPDFERLGANLQPLAGLDFFGENRDRGRACDRGDDQ